MNKENILFLDLSLQPLFQVTRTILVIAANTFDMVGIRRG
jgi:hypothetical protein